MRVDVNDAEFFVQSVVDPAFHRNRYGMIAADHGKFHALRNQSFDISLHLREQGIAVFIDKITGIQEFKAVVIV